MPDSPSISVVMPTWNEAGRIQDTLHHLVKTGAPAEILVVDGQSDDGTLEAAAALKNSVPTRVIGLVSPKRGRAAQMNHGAERASGEILLFLHADTLLPAGWDRAAAETLAAPNTAAGFYGYSLDKRSPGLAVI